jgi:hypothetical protein
MITKKSKNPFISKVKRYQLLRFGINFNRLKVVLNIVVTDQFREAADNQPLVLQCVQMPLIHQSFQLKCHSL